MTFQPDWVCSPGESILAAAQARDWAVDELEERLGLCAGSFEDLRRGSRIVDAELARRISRLLGGSESFWMRREQIYRHRVQGSSLAVAEQWAKAANLTDLVKFGWIDEELASVDKLVASLQFFGVSSYDEWMINYGAKLRAVAFRSGNNELYNFPTLAWLRRGEIEALAADVPRWDRSRFEDSLKDARTLTKLKDPQVFLPRLKAICASAGVCLVVAPAPKSCSAHGATYFVRNELPVLQLSFRFKTDDQFWFTFFHEAAHLIKHDRSLIFIEGEDFISTPEEEEANKFAADFLIPREYRDYFDDFATNSKSIMRLAVKLGISPGIVVGQMQHSRIIPFSKYQWLKRRFTWSDTEGFVSREKR